jgi:hypothetical protein
MKRRGFSFVEIFLACFLFRLAFNPSEIKSSEIASLFPAKAGKPCPLGNLWSQKKTGA